MRSRHKRLRGEEEERTDPRAWMTTYSDMMSLLMCFFVALFAFSTIDLNRFREAIISIQGALGVLTGGPRPLSSVQEPLSTGLSRSELEKAEMRRSQLRGLMQRLDGFLKQRGLEDLVRTELSEVGLTVSFMDRVLFRKGEADLLPGAFEILHEVAEILRDVPNNIRIEGHTCDLPIHTPRYPSNWELSTSRATNVLRFLVEKENLEPFRMSAVGYGEYRPRVPNTSEANRAQNRRVDMVILPLDDSALEGLKTREAEKESEGGEENGNRAG